MWYPESVYLLNVRERFCERLTVTVSWRVTQELIVQQHPSHILFTGLDYMLTWHTLSVLVPLVQCRRVAIINGWEFIPVQPFTSWAMDMIGPFPTTKLGNNWIVTWVDRTTKTIVAAAAAAPQ